jgi:hypothetical protein
VGHVARMGEARNVHRFLMAVPLGDRLWAGR